MPQATDTVDDALFQYGTVRQVEILEAIQEHGSIRAAARALKVNFGTIRFALERVKSKAAAAGYSPEHDLTRPIAPGFTAKGHSTLYRRGEPEPVLQWVKTTADQQAQETMRQEMLAAWLEDVPPAKPGPAPSDHQSDIIPWIQIGDAHIGLLCQVDEVGQSWNLKIAEAELVAAVFRLIDEAPNSERIVINDLGDATHYSNFAAVSNNSGHSFDFDTRYPKMIRVYSRIMRACIDRALTKAKHVDILVNQGNHSRENDVWMAELIRVTYEHTGRVHVLNNDSVFIAYRMGKTLVMVHHSDRCKPRDLVGVMVTDFRKDFGETEHHLIDVGHVHHHFVSKEYPSVVIESWNHLAATDRWAHDQGYRSRKSISMVFRSKTYGEVGRRLLPIEEVRDILERAGKGRVIREKEVFTV